MIEAKNISKSFGTHLVLNNISVTFEQGKINLIIG
ncbi:MAG TPA: ABC transporter ATP-binding protein, partial [Bacteroidales bacterium]|nr:ABC transporter ATP-binding protein [Bacteroidales bacterium]